MLNQEQGHTPPPTMFNLNQALFRVIYSQTQKRFYLLIIPEELIIKKENKASSRYAKLTSAYRYATSRECVQ